MSTPKGNDSAADPQAQNTPAHEKSATPAKPKRQKPDLEGAKSSAHLTSGILNVLCIPVYLFALVMLLFSAPSDLFGGTTEIDCSSDVFACTSFSPDLFWGSFGLIFGAAAIAGLIGYTVGRIRWGSGNLMRTLWISIVQAVVTTFVGFILAASLLLQ